MVVFVLDLCVFNVVNVNIWLVIYFHDNRIWKDGVVFVLGCGLVVGYWGLG